jgi:hypothetical protein
MRLKIVASTDSKYTGDEIDIDSPALGTLSKKQIQAFAATIYEGRFVPDAVLYQGDRVRLVNSNYSVTFEDVTPHA